MLTQQQIEELIVMTEPPQYKVGDLVCSKQTGFPGVAMVIGVMPAALYSLGRDFSPNRWEELYPGWIYKYLYSVYYEEPRRNVTQEEFLKGYPPQELEFFKEEKIQELYERRVPEIRVILYPEQDLELFQ